MNAETSLTLTNVNDDIVQVELDQGTLNLHIRHLFGGETYEIDTPNQAFTILKAGDYRFDVDPNADTTSVAVWRGEGEANGQGPGVKIKSGHQATFPVGLPWNIRWPALPTSMASMIGAGCATTVKIMRDPINMFRPTWWEPTISTNMELGGWWQLRPGLGTDGGAGLGSLSLRTLGVG